VSLRLAKVVEVELLRKRIIRALRRGGSQAGGEFAGVHHLLDLFERAAYRKRHY